MSDPHTATIINCIKVFEDEHGINHDKWFHSKALYTILHNILDTRAHFDYTSGFEYRTVPGKIGGYMLFTNSESSCKTIVHHVENENLNSIYKRIMNTKNPTLMKRIAKLQNLVPPFKNPWEDNRASNNEYMRIFIKYALAKKLRGFEYNEFERLVSNKRKKDDLDDAKKFAIEMALSCTIS